MRTYASRTTSQEETYERHCWNTLKSRRHETQTLCEHLVDNNVTMSTWLGIDNLDNNEYWEPALTATLHLPREIFNMHCTVARLRDDIGYGKERSIADHMSKTAKK
eukprot:4764822-Amphidinium_carterae.1